MVKRVEYTIFASLFSKIRLTASVMGIPPFDFFLFFLFFFCHGVSKTVFFEASGDVKNGPF